MTSLTSLLSIANMGLQAQTAGLDAAGQNVANANTPGYSRVSAHLETTSVADGYAGSVQVTGIGRTVDQFAFANLVTEQGKSGAATARSDALATTQNIVAPSTTIADDINTFFTSTTTLEGSPSDPSARAGVLAAATQVAQDFSTTANALTSQRSSLLSQAQSTSTTLNTQLSQIAKLNGQIATAVGGGNEPTDLEDQRDALVSTVSTAIGAQVIPGANGQVTLLSSGTALVSGTSAATIGVTLDSSQNLKITATIGNGTANDITPNVTSGTLGGIREARDTDIPSAQSQLDSFANDFTTSVNAVQSSGYGLDGVTGRNLFTPSATVAGAAAAMTVDPSVAGNPSAIAASSTAAGVPGNNDIAVKLNALATSNLAGGSTPTTTYANLAASVGNAKSSADSETSLRTSTVTQATNLNSSVSGVNIDDEMTNLSAFQRAYEANSKVLQTVDTLLQGLMEAL
jgi:flagellar hook-associated protein 1 FlgK